MMVVVMNSVRRERRSLNRVLHALALITKTARGGNCAALVTASDGRGSNYDFVPHEQHGRRMSDYHQQFQQEDHTGLTQVSEAPRRYGGCVNNTSADKPFSTAVRGPKGISPSLAATHEYAAVCVEI